MTTAQFGLDTTSHNISNVDTAGYTRQRIVSTAYDPFATIGKFLPVDQALVGGGVRIDILDQIRSQYLDRRFRSENTTNAYWEQRTQSFTYLESFFDNVNEKTSINYSMAEFFKAMKIVAEDPVAGAPRTLLQTAAMDLVQQLNMVYDGLVDLQSIENRSVQTKVGDINRIAGEFAELNKAIYGFEITGMIANDLRDKRNLLIDELSRYIDIEYSEYPDMYGHSMFELRVGGVLLVDHDRASTLSVRPIPNVLPDDPETGWEAEMAWEPYWEEMLRPTRFNPNRNAVVDDGTTLDMTRITGGELKAHIDMRDGVGNGADSTKRGIPYYIEMINNLARALVFEVNAIHTQGWTDHPNGSRTGVNFFHFDEENPYSWMAVNADGDIIRRDPADPNIWLDANGEVVADTTGYILEIDMATVTAKNIRLSDDILASPYNIAASSTEIKRANLGESEELQRGNNENMNALYDLFRKTGITMLGRDIGSFDDYGTVVRFDVGNTLRTAKKAGETSRILTLAAENQRTSIAGVSLDEEMVGLVKYQHAYNGAARVITAMDDALDRLINGTGRVGL